MFALLDVTEETEDGRVFHPTQIRSSRVLDAEKLGALLAELRDTLTANNKDKTMLSEILKHLDGHDALYDFADAIVQVRLKMTREMYREELQRLNNMGSLSNVQQEDFNILTGDVEALTRVMAFYGFDEENEDA